MAKRVTHWYCDRCKGKVTKGRGYIQIEIHPQLDTVRLLIEHPRCTIADLREAFEEIELASATALAAPPSPPTEATSFEYLNVTATCPWGLEWTIYIFRLRAVVSLGVPVLDRL